MLLILLLLAGFFGFQANALVSSSNLFISEVAVGIESSKNEFIEIKNHSSEKIDLQEYGLKLQLVNSSGKATNKEIEWKNPTIDPDGFFLFGTGSISAPFDATYSSASLTGNGGVIITDKNDVVIDIVSWTDLETDESLERTSYTREDSEDNWQKSYVLGGTPGKENSKKPETKIYSGKIYINEFLPAPSPGKEEYIELFNPTVDDIDISKYLLKDASNTGRYAFPDGTKIKSADYLAVYKRDYKFALNNSGAETVISLDPDEKTVSTVSYSGSKTDVSYNFDGKNWKQSQFLTPGQKNKFNNPPEVKGKKAQKIYVNTYAEFSATGSDADKDALKFTWDFGDGHKSYLKKTHHKYEKAGKYKVALKVSDGSEDVFQNFNIEVKKFPKSKITIVSVSPNPKGKDSDLEYITLKNETKKKIDLKDWIIATGSKNLYNHKINGTLVIKPGQTIQVTRKISKFTLNNQESKVELRYPTGKTASKLSYKKVSGGIAEDEIYTKESGAWAWVAPKTINKLAIAEKLVPAEPSSQQGEKPAVLVAYGKNFSEDENSRKNNIENFIQPQGIVLGAYKYKPSFFAYQNEQAYWEIIFAKLNSAINYFLNNFFLKSVP